MSYCNESPREGFQPTLCRSTTFLCPYYFSVLSVPSRAPSNVTFTNVRSTEVTVNWNPLPEQYANGRLSGYIVYFQEAAYHSVSSNTSSVNVTANSTSVTLTGLRPGQRYYTYISAFTSKGVGPRSYFYYITTGRYLKRQTGWSFAKAITSCQPLEVIRDWMEEKTPISRQGGGRGKTFLLGYWEDKCR